MPQEILHYETIAHPSDKWMVFIHGAGGSIKTWKYQVDDFKNYANLLLIDLRDHGLSKDIIPEAGKYTFDLIADDIEKVLDDANIGKAIFISLSMGSLVIQKLALRRPNAFLVGIIAGGMYHVNWRIMAFVNSANILTKFLPYRAMYWLFSRLVMPRKNHRFSRQVFNEQSKKLTAAEYNRWITLYQEFRNVLAEFYERELTFPLLVVMGDQDYIFLNAAQRYVQKHPAKAKIEIIEKCDHVCNVEKPAEFNQLSIEFLRKLKLIA